MDWTVSKTVICKSLHDGTLLDLILLRPTEFKLKVKEKASFKCKSSPLVEIDRLCAID